MTWRESCVNRVIEHMRNKRYVPQNKAELARALEIGSKDKARFRELIDSLAENGTIQCLSKGKYRLPSEAKNRVRATIRILRSGKIVAIFKRNDPVLKTLHIDPDLVPEAELTAKQLFGALDGDEVLLHIKHRTERRGRRGKHGARKQTVCHANELKARVDSIVRRAREQWLGVLHADRQHRLSVRGDGISAPRYIKLTSANTLNAKPGQLVMVTPEREQSAERSCGRITEVLGYPDAPHVDMLAVIKKYNLATEFGEQVLQELACCQAESSETELARREDWTEHCVITIDPASAKDFDDAIAICATEYGWELAVHIADVAHFVKPNTALDAEALQRGNSTYLPDRVLPMLPPRLSDDLCSLRPGELRLTKVCVMQFDKHGKMLRSRFADAFIKSRARLTYEQAYAMIQGQGTDVVAQTVRTVWQLASILRRNRYAQGALDLDFPELKVVIDNTGHVSDILTEEYDESHQLIEECMLAANEAAAMLLKNKQRPTVYRVHEEPDAAKLFEFAQLCKLYGYSVHDLTQRRYLNELLEQIAGGPDAQLLKLALLKSLMRARYDTEPLGHFGLATPNYCHFTSPIRRYADLIVHRSLAPLLDNAERHAKGAGGVAVLQQAAEHISETERISAAAEKDAQRIKLFEWLDEQSHLAEPRLWQGLIVEARHFGLLVEIPALQIKGLIKRQDMGDDSWVFEPFAQRWKNAAGNILCAGLHVPLVPVRVDREAQWADFAVAGASQGSPKGGKVRRRGSPFGRRRRHG